ncbi:MAG TPA: phage portal protein [Chloroflexota bacterium]|nr:phage portal protein [Chloroflexota bacterium]
MGDTLVVMQAIGTAITRLVGTPPALSPVDLAYAARTESLERDREYLHHSNYYQGHQRDPRPLLTNPLARVSSLGAGDYNWQPRHNALAKVIDTLVNRLSVYGFTADGLSDVDRATVATLLGGWWRAARMDEVQNTLHAQAFITGDAYLVTRIGAAGRPYWTYHHALTMLPVYDSEGTMRACYQVLSEYIQDDGLSRERRRLTIYRPGEISKYWSWAGVGEWKLWTEDGDGGLIPWLDTQGQPLGIPVHHFRNRPRGADFGTSELEALIPLQDEYNRRVYNVSQAAAYAGSTQKYIVDAGAAPANPDGTQPVTYKSGPGDVWLIQSRGEHNANVGSFPASDLAQAQDVADRELRTIAAFADIPLYLFLPEGALPSGESLKVSEGALVAKCRDRAITFGDAWEDAQTMALRLAARFAGMSLPDPATYTLTTQWAPFETRSAESDARVVGMIGDLLGPRESLRVLGYTDEEADRIAEEKTAAGEMFESIDYELRRVQLENARSLLESRQQLIDERAAAAGDA